MAVVRRVGDSAGTRLHHVRLLLPVHRRRVGTAGRRVRRGRRRAGCRAVDDAAPHYPADAGARTGRRGVAGLHDLDGLLQRAVRVRRRLSRADHPDLREQAERRPGDGSGRDSDPRLRVARLSRLSAALRDGAGVHRGGERAGSSGGAGAFAPQPHDFDGTGNAGGRISSSSPRHGLSRFLRARGHLDDAVSAPPRTRWRTTVRS